MKRFFLSPVAVAAALGFAPALAQTAIDAPGAHMRMAKPLTRAEFVEKVQKHFARFDTNHDGFVTPDEVQASAQSIDARMKERGSKMFDRLDVDHDGIVNKSDFDAAMANRQQRAGSHRHVPTWDRFAARFDTNHDGEISRAEFDAARAQRMAQSGKPYLHSAGFEAKMFAFADLNHDGRVSLQEAQQAAQQWFDAADTNHDGILSPDEMRAMHKRMHPKG